MMQVNKFLIVIFTIASAFAAMRDDKEFALETASVFSNRYLHIKGEDSQTSITRRVESSKEIQQEIARRLSSRRMQDAHDLLYQDAVERLIHKDTPGNYVKFLFVMHANEISEKSRQFKLSHPLDQIDDEVTASFTARCFVGYRVNCPEFRLQDTEIVRRTRQLKKYITTGKAGDLDLNDPITLILYWRINYDRCRKINCNSTSELDSFFRKKSSANQDTMASTQSTMVSFQ